MLQADLLDLLTKCRRRHGDSATVAVVSQISSRWSAQFQKLFSEHRVPVVDQVSFGRGTFWIMYLGT